MAAVNDVETDIDDEMQRVADLGDNTQIFRPTHTGEQFMYAKENFAVFSGPFGNGKTRASIERAKWVMQTQTPHYPVSKSRGVRLTRGAILAGTYPRLRRTILKDVREWFPTGAAKIKQSTPHEGIIRFGAENGDEVICEVVCFAGDSDTFYDDFGSTALSWAYFIEIQTMARWDFVSLGMDRTGRYKGPGGGHPLGKVVFGCMNWRDQRHWTYKKLVQEQSPPNWKLFRGPPAFRFCPLDEVHSVTANEGRMLHYVFGVNKFEQLPLMEFKSEPGYWIPNPMAENINNIESKMDITWRVGSKVFRHKPPDVLQGFAYYWDMLVRNETDDYITRFVMGDPAASRVGRAVYPKFKRRAHVSRTHLTPRPGQLICGTDPGLEHSCFLIAQLQDDGLLRVIREIVGENQTLEDFRDYDLVPVLRREFPHYLRDMIVLNDLTGDRQDRGTGLTWADYLNEIGISATPSVAHEYAIRQNAVNHYLGRTDLIQIDPSCSTLIDALDGAYSYLPVQGTDRHRDQPNKKSVYSSPVDCLESICTWLRTQSDMNYVQHRRDARRGESINFG